MPNRSIRYFSKRPGNVHQYIGSIGGGGGSPSASRYAVSDAVADWPTSTESGAWAAFNVPNAPIGVPASATEVNTGNIGSALTQDDVHIRLTPGYYGSVTIGGADKIIELADGAELGQITFASGLTRCILRGQNPRDGLINSFKRAGSSSSVTDLLIDGVTIDSSQRALGLLGSDTLSLIGDRIAMIGSRVNIDGQGMYATGSVRGSDLLIANCLLTRYAAATSGTHAFRIMGFERVFIVDCMADFGADGSMLRIHGSGGGDINDVYVLRLQSEGTGPIQIRGSDQGVGFTGPNNVGRVRVEDSHFYRAGSIIANAQLGDGDSDEPNVVEWINNVAHRTGFSWPTLLSSAPLAGWTVSGNTVTGDGNVDTGSWSYLNGA